MTREKKHLYEDWSGFQALAQAQNKKLAADDPFSPGLLSLIQDSMNQNLAHARHVESQRLSYCATVTALCGLGLGFVTSENAMSTLAKLLVCGILLLFTLLSSLLSNRWSNAFERHLEYAKGCYYTLHHYYLGDMDEPNGKQKEELFLEDAEDLSLKHLPLYCFNINDPHLFNILLKTDKRRTKQYFLWYYRTIILLVLVISVLIVIGTI